MLAYCVSCLDNKDKSMKRGPYDKRRRVLHPGVLHEPDEEMVQEPDTDNPAIVTVCKQILYCVMLNCVSQITSQLEKAQIDPGGSTTSSATATSKQLVINDHQIISDGMNPYVEQYMDQQGMSEEMKHVHRKRIALEIFLADIVEYLDTQGDSIHPDALNLIDRSLTPARRVMDAIQEVHRGVPSRRQTRDNMMV